MIHFPRWDEVFTEPDLPEAKRESFTFTIRWYLAGAAGTPSDGRSIRLFDRGSAIEDAKSMISFSADIFYPLCPMHCEVTCPTCFETFSVPGPAASEVPTEWDYDCEVCCRPMMIRFRLDGDEVTAQAVADQ